jgi:HK97 family phage portal protein
MALGDLIARLWRNRGRPTSIVWGSPPMGSGRPYGFDFEGQEPQSLPSIFGCCALLSDALVSLDWQITKPAANGGRELVVEGAAPQCLERWNKSDRWCWTWNALQSGNGIAHVLRNDQDEPTRIEVYPAGRAFLNLYDDNTLRFSLAPMAGESLEADDADVVHLKYRPSGLDSRIGVPPTVTVNPTIQMLLASRAGVTATQTRASRPSGFLSTAGRLNPDQAQAIKDRWDATHGGPNQRGGTPVLEQGLSYTPIDPADLNKLVSIETANLGVAEVCRLYGVPQSILQSDASGSRSSAVEDRRRLGAFAVSPLARLIEDAIAAKLLTQRQRDMGLMVTVDTSASLVGEGTEMAEVLSKLANAGIITPNEGRAWLQYGSAGDAADLLRAPANTWPIENWSQAMPKSAEPMPTNTYAASRALRLINGSGGRTVRPALDAIRDRDNADAAE